jgi:hypothetical protein
LLSSPLTPHEFNWFLQVVVLASFSECSGFSLF